MLILNATNIQKSFGDRQIIDVSQLQIFSDDKIGLVGKNGSGKTTLLKILTGELVPDQGDVQWFGEFAYLPQLEKSMEKLALEVASEFTVVKDIHPHLSGGEYTRLQLAKVFSSNSHLIITDEPTTNLDVAGIRLVEEKLLAYPGAMIIVAHDRELLDQVCNKIWEIDQCKITTFTGNYSAYLMQKQEQVERQYLEYEKYTKEKERLHQSIIAVKERSQSMKSAPSRMGNSEARLHKGVTKDRKAKVERIGKSLISRLERLEVKAKPFEEKPLSFDFIQHQQVHAKYVVSAEEVSVKAGSKNLIKSASFTIPKGSKTVLLGENGSGKTTLLKMLVTKNQKIRIAGGAKLGYFAQNLDLPLEKTVIDCVMENSLAKENEARLILARLLFKQNDVHKPIKVLSGGERVRLALARIILQDSNLLILDEPTNYLDLPTQEALAEVLTEYPGTIIFVSHDRYFINQVAHRLLIIEDQQLLTFEGNYLEYQNSKVTANESQDLLVLKHRLAELTNKLAVPSTEDNIEQLDQEFKELVALIRKLENSHP